MNVKIIVKPQKSQFLRLTYFLTANFRDFEVYDIHLAENIVVIRGPRACGDEQLVLQRVIGNYLYTWNYGFNQYQFIGSEK
jgi:hypothetical protein